MNQSGTIAASAQAAIGNVLVGSFSAMLTSAGAGGYGLAAIVGGALATGGAICYIGNCCGRWQHSHTHEAGVSRKNSEEFYNHR
jgi:hypothetical protein